MQLKERKKKKFFGGIGEKEKQSLTAWYQKAAFNQFRVVSNHCLTERNFYLKTFERAELWRHLLPNLRCLRNR